MKGAMSHHELVNKMAGVACWEERKVRVGRGPDGRGSLRIRLEWVADFVQFDGAA